MAEGYSEEREIDFLFMRDVERLKDIGKSVKHNTINTFEGYRDIRRRGLTGMGGGRSGSLKAGYRIVTELIKAETCSVQRGFKRQKSENNGNGN